MSKVLDLHGVRHADVDRLVENFILLEQPPLTILCGNSDKMIRLVKDVLKRYDKINWKSWNHNTFKIL
tara:strand:- start:681 stop:884 length:204 start_codon:yes stop_codon:yes gene_type:complete